jgi:aspartyl-tRNA(Asn)/glutamyl-tRNA(Gln) amidotransferase subunit A
MPNSSLTIAQASQQIRRGEISPTDIVRECLDHIERLNPTLNAFITVTPDSALGEAQEAEKEIRSAHWRGPLHGIPIGLKDLIDTAGVGTTAASAIFRDRLPVEDADVVKKLRAAGAVFIGKQNLHEFAYGGSSVISHFGTVRNPLNPEFIAGGSSGGSAAAVASGMCFAAIGTDTAGSIRLPASLCGVVGFKPTYGLVSTRGIVPLSTSLDHAGPITRTVEDAVLVMNAITNGPPRFRDSLKTPPAHLKLGIPRRHFYENVDPQILAAVERAVDSLKEQGATAHEIELPIDEDRTVFLFESHAYHRDKIAGTPELYHPETLRRVRNGAEISNADYQRALAQLQRLRREIVEQLSEVDVIVTPTTPALTPQISELTEDISRLRPAEILLLRNTRPINVWGLPAISVPCGFTSEGMPIGLQIAAAPGEDKKVLQAAHIFEHLGRFTPALLT